MPDPLRPKRVVPSTAVVEAAIVLLAAWASVGFVNPGMENVIARPPVNVPADSVIVKTKGPVPARAAVPAGFPNLGAVKVRAAVPEFARAKPVPKSVMTSLPLLATVDTGVSETVMVTPVAALATVLRTMAGEAAPRSAMQADDPVVL